MGRAHSGLEPQWGERRLVRITWQVCTTRTTYIELGIELAGRSAQLVQLKRRNNIFIFYFSSFELYELYIPANEFYTELYVSSTSCTKP